MSKKTRNVIERAEELLTAISENLETANNLLYTCLMETIEINEKICLIALHVEKLTGEPVRVKVDMEAVKALAEKQTPKVEEAEIPKTVFPQFRKKGEK